ncbi:MAG: hypothetical protein AAGC81_19315 [Pseudomonadota bacterium]
MTKWALTESDDAVVLAPRGIAPHWDLAVERSLPCPTRCSRRHVARQIRQDLWRAMQVMRGFVPIVSVSWADQSAEIRAGGRFLCGAAPPNAFETIASVLDNEDNRRRWLAHATRQKP